MEESSYSTLKKMKKKDKKFHINASNKTSQKKILKKKKYCNINVKNKIIQRKKNKKKEKKTNTRIDWLILLLMKIQKLEWPGNYCNNRNESKITMSLSQLKINLSFSFLISNRKQNKINNLGYHKSLNILPVFLSIPIYKKTMSQLSNWIVLPFL